jgi:peptidoglycan/xylan/chitin deacetylase (PgdA/CDA1 family)
MTLPASVMWHHLPQDIETHLDACLAAALAQRPHADGPMVFFRADDVAVPGRQLADMLAVFARWDAPLSLAVVPAWITALRWNELKQLAGKASGRWCWHQHGWRHKNHETEGKKQEFGPSRPAVDIRSDLELGRSRLETILGNDFTRIFTPPWNRCDRRTLDILAESGYQAVSRFSGGWPPAPPGLPDIAMTLDLHTRKESDPKAAWHNLLTELRQSLSAGCCGVMLHHRRMNAAALSFLELLLRSMLRYKNMNLMPMPALAKVQSPSL